MACALQSRILSLTLVFFACAAGASIIGQVKQPENAPAQQQVDVDDLLQECQQVIRGQKYVGLVWWIPVEFWEAGAAQNPSSGAQTAEQFKPLREYTLVAVVVGKVGGFGSISFAPSADVRANTLLRDATGAEYRPLESVSAEAQMLAQVVRPIFSGAVGRMGENIELLYFPAKNKEGQPLADPRQRMKFSIVLRQIAGPSEVVFEWQLPLTALSAPKFCPVGNERVKANWRYCPWHGAPLDGSPPPAPAKKG